MSKVYYARDTSASRRTRALYSSRCDIETADIHCDNNNNKDDITRASLMHHRDVIKKTNHQKWDQVSMDSGFCSDLERKVAQMSITGSDVGSLDGSVCDAIEPNDVRAPCRAKLTEEEKRKRSKIRTLPPPGRATRWHQCDDVREDFSDHDNDVDPRSNTSYVAYMTPSRNSERKSKSLPVRCDNKHDVITWDDVMLTDLRQIRVLGGGGYARVDLVEIRRCPGHRFALKKLNKGLLQERNQVGHVISEKEALKHARSRFIPRLYQTFQTPSHVFMLTEACLGGDLFSVLENYGALSHDATHYVIGCVIEALDHLHRVLHIIHRDVKTENILIDSNGVAKLADLGFCKRLLHNSDTTYTFCGTPGYVAPEVLLRTGHGRSCDFFSTGVVMFESATCRSPFRRHSSIDTHRATLRGIKDVAFPPFVNHVTVQMIRALCCNDPDQRIGAGGCEQVRRHEFFCGFDWHLLRQGKLKSPLLNHASRLPDHTSSTTAAKDDYLESLTEIVKTPFDKTWSENF